MPNKSKQKGDRFERQIVNDLRDSGINAERTLEKGARSDGSQTWDIDIPTPSKTYKAECKSRKDSFKTDYEWLQGVDFVFKKSNGKKAIVMMDYDLFKKFINNA